MKKLIIALFSLCMAFSLSACATDNNNEATVVTEVSTESSATESSATESSEKIETTADESDTENPDVTTTEENEESVTDNESIKALQNIIGTENKIFSYIGEVTISGKTFSEISYSYKTEPAKGITVAKILVDEDGNCYIKDGDEPANIGAPAIPSELNELYKEAAAVFNKIYFCEFDFDYDNQINSETESTIVPIKDEHFGTVKEMDEYLNSLFTEDFVNYIKNDRFSYMFHDIDGKLYIQEGGIGSALGYQFTSYKPVIVEDDHYVFEQKSYLFVDWQENPEFEIAREGTLEFVKTDKGWRIKQFQQVN